jgi:hypothetical protein
LNHDITCSTTELENADRRRTLSPSQQRCNILAPPATSSTQLCLSFSDYGEGTHYSSCSHTQEHPVNFPTRAGLSASFRSAVNSTRAFKSNGLQKQCGLIGRCIGGCHIRREATERGNRREIWYSRSTNQGALSEVRTFIPCARRLYLRGCGGCKITCTTLPKPMSQMRDGCAASILGGAAPPVRPRRHSRACRVTQSKHSSGYLSRLEAVPRSRVR